jgi:hypothetical protein
MTQYDISFRLHLHATRLVRFCFLALFLSLASTVQAFTGCQTQFENMLSYNGWQAGEASLRKDVDEDLDRCASPADHQWAAKEIADNATNPYDTVAAFWRCIQPICENALKTKKAPSANKWHVQNDQVALKCISRTAMPDGTMELTNNCNQRVNLSWCLLHDEQNSASAAGCRPKRDGASSTGFWYDQQAAFLDYGKTWRVPLSGNVIFVAACYDPYDPHIVRFSTQQLTPQSHLFLDCIGWDHQ